MKDQAHILMCMPMVLAVTALVALGAGAFAVVLALTCAAMFGAGIAIEVGDRRGGEDS